ncbi:MAG: MFS transporter [Pseudomonadota bacterium]|nr:MFS transporter [Pseudomonadota bacterium]
MNAKTKAIWGWMFYDFATQPFYTLLLTFLFGPYIVKAAYQYYTNQGFSEQVSDQFAQIIWANTNMISGIIIAISAPFWGYFCQKLNISRLAILLSFSIIVACSGLLWWAYPDGSTIHSSLMFFGIGYVAVGLSQVLIDTQLVDYGEKGNFGKLSGQAFAFGYLGGIIALILMMIFFIENDKGLTLFNQEPALGLGSYNQGGNRFSGPFSAIWMTVFILPYVKWVLFSSEKILRLDQNHSQQNSLNVLNYLKAWRERRSMTIFLLASMLFRDALGGVFAFGGTYATLVLNMPVMNLGIFGIVTGIASAFFSFIGGYWDVHYGSKRMILVAIITLTLTSLGVIGIGKQQFFYIDFSVTPWIIDVIFYSCGVMIGGFGGILQASSRALMAKHLNEKDKGLGFGLYALSGRVTSFLAPMLISLVTYITGSVRLGVSPIILLFICSFLVMLSVDEPSV